MVRTWNCAFCRAENLDHLAFCHKCNIRKGCLSLNERSLCVLHATTEKNFAGICEKGFIITETPVAGRSMGDGIYAYAYTGGEIDPSVKHAVGSCREKREPKFVICQMKFDLTPDQVCIFDQPEWDRLGDEEGLSNYEALVRVGGRELADEAKQIQTERYAARLEQMNDDLKAGKVPLMRPGDFENIRPDQIAQAAMRMGKRVFLSLHDNSLLFFYPDQDLKVEKAWITEDAPNVGSGPAVVALFETCNRQAQETFAQWQVVTRSDKVKDARRAASSSFQSADTVVNNCPVPDRFSGVPVGGMIAGTANQLKEINPLGRYFESNLKIGSQTIFGGVYWQCINIKGVSGGELQYTLKRLSP
jgi:hypothetical protein